MLEYKPRDFNPRDQTRSFKTSKRERDYGKGYRRTQKGKRKLRIAHIRYSQKLRLKTFEKLGGKCVVCGESDWRCLQIDHVNGGGHTELKEIGRVAIYLKILKNRCKNGEYQLLCANCNWRKRYDRNEQGHKGLGLFFMENRKQI